MARRVTGILTVILLAGIITSISVPGPVSGEENGSFRFVFMTDIHVMPELNGAQGFEAAIARVNGISPDFVITGGDLIHDGPGTSYERVDSLYRLYDDLCKKFEMPVYNTIGNHEIFGLYIRSGVDTAHQEFGKKMFEKRIGGGSTSSSFDFKGWHFILLDTIGFTGSRDYFGHVGLETLEWLARDLERIASDTPIVLCVHIPLVSPFLQTICGATNRISPSEMVTNAPEVLSMFEGRDLRLVLQGHLHVVDQAQVKGTKFVTGGAVSGSWWRGPFKGFPEGFVVVEIRGDEIDYRYETYGWKAGGPR